jgi:hypothetical protein
MRFRVTAAVWLMGLCSVTASAAPFVVIVSDAVGVPEAWVRKVQKATVESWGQVASPLVESSPLAWSGPRSCEPRCFANAVSKLASRDGVVLSVRSEPKSDRAVVEMLAVVDGKASSQARGEVPLEGFEKALKMLLERAVPPWAAKGFGGITLVVPAGAVVKIDGQVQTRSSKDPTFPAGVGLHTVDIVYANGDAWLRTVSVAEGERLSLDGQSTDEVRTAVRSANVLSPLRVTSYVAFSVGAASAAGGLVAGALAKQTAVGVQACEGELRNCTPLTEAQSRSEQSQRLASVGNVMLGVGIGLAVTGIALYVFDLAVSP